MRENFSSRQAYMFNEGNGIELQDNSEEINSPSNLRNRSLGRSPPHDNVIRGTSNRSAMYQRCPTDALQTSSSSDISSVNSDLNLFGRIKLTFQKMFNKKYFERTPHRSAVLRAHYNWSADILLLMFVYYTLREYWEDKIICREHFQLNRASPEIEKLCMKSPYTVLSTSNHSLNESERYYIGYYPFITSLFLFGFVIFKCLILFVVQMEYDILRKFLIILQNTRNYNKRLSKTYRYFIKNYGYHHKMINSIIYLNCIAMAFNVVVMLSINMLLNGSYLLLPLYLNEPRDYTFFDDPYSRLFPPFALCSITPKLQTQVGRSQLYGCHLSVNDVNSKFFIAFWLWQMALASWSLSSIIYWNYVSLKTHSNRYLLNDGSYKRFPNVEYATKILDPDESLALSIIKPYLYGPHYRYLVETMCEICEGNSSDINTTLSCETNPNVPQVLRLSKSSNAEGDLNISTDHALSNRVNTRTVSTAGELTTACEVGISPEMCADLDVDEFSITDYRNRDNSINAYNKSKSSINENSHRIDEHKLDSLLGYVDFTDKTPRTVTLRTKMRRQSAENPKLRYSLTKEESTLMESLPNTTFTMLKNVDDFNCPAEKEDKQNTALYPNKTVQSSPSSHKLRSKRTQIERNRTPYDRPSLPSIPEVTEVTPEPMDRVRLLEAFSLRSAANLPEGDFSFTGLTCHDSDSFSNSESETEF